MLHGSKLLINFLTKVTKIWRGRVVVILVSLLVKRAKYLSNPLLFAKRGLTRKFATVKSRKSSNYNISKKVEPCVWHLTRNFVCRKKSIPKCIFWPVLTSNLTVKEEKKRKKEQAFFSIIVDIIRFFYRLGSPNTLACRVLFTFVRAVGRWWLSYVMRFLLSLLRRHLLPAIKWINIEICVLVN